MRGGSFAEGWLSMARFWKAVFTANSSFNLSSSSLKDVINLLGGAQAPTTKQLQDALDKIPLDKAKQYKDALKILIDDYVDVCYLGVEEFKGSQTANAMNLTALPNATDWGTWGGQKSGYINWSSSLFVLDAKVFHIAAATAANRWEVGFVQHCVQKDNVTNYSNGVKVNQHPPTAAPWGDSGQPAHVPWYTKGMHNGLRAWATMAPGINTVNYGMNDSFNNRKHPYKCIRMGGVVLATYVTSLDCKQKFTTYLMRQDGNDAQTRTLFKKITYTIKGEGKFNATGQVSGASSSVDIGQAENMIAGTQLPGTSVNDMNNCERWFANNVQVG